MCFAFSWKKGGRIKNIVWGEGLGRLDAAGSTVGVNSRPVPGHHSGALASGAGTDTSWGGQIWRGACPMQRGEQSVGRGAEGPKLGWGLQ